MNNRYKSPVLLKKTHKNTGPLVIHNGFAIKVLHVKILMRQLVGFSLNLRTKTGRKADKIDKMNTMNRVIYNGDKLRKDQIS